MNIEDFIAERVGSDYKAIYNDKEYQKYADVISSLYSIMDDNFNTKTGEQLSEELKALYNNLVEISNMYSYKKGLKDGIRLGELLSEI